jgi:ABC-type glycerol-3-phosphate transport system substrate-binding protein
MTRARFTAFLAAAVGLLVAGAGAGDGAGTPVGAVNTAVSGTIVFDGVWTARTGQPQFQSVINRFERLYPNVHVDYRPIGPGLPIALEATVAAGHPPDMADLAQPGAVQELVNAGKLKPITYASSVIGTNFAPRWKALGAFDGKLYALVFKAANKSVVWYSPPAFRKAGVQPPKTFAGLLEDAARIDASGLPAYSIGGAEGWTLTDMFENIYLRTFGPVEYGLLSRHRIPWTSPSVTVALRTMVKILGDTANIYRGTNGALQTGFNQSVTNVFSPPSRAAMVFEGDFVGGVIADSTGVKPGTGFNTFTWPSITPSYASSVEIAGDLIVTFKDNPAIEAFVEYLATPAAAAVWAKQGGFGTGNHNMPTSVYPDPITRRIEAQLLTAKSVVFDMSDTQPTAFGSTAGQGEWGLFQNLLAQPADYKSIQRRLEAAAAAAYKK